MRFHLSYTLSLPGSTQHPVAVREIWFIQRDRDSCSTTIEICQTIIVCVWVWRGRSVSRAPLYYTDILYVGTYCVSPSLYVQRACKTLQCMQWIDWATAVPLPTYNLWTHVKYYLPVCVCSVCALKLSKCHCWVKHQKFYRFIYVLYKVSGMFFYWFRGEWTWIIIIFNIYLPLKFCPRARNNGGKSFRNGFSQFVMFKWGLCTIAALDWHIFSKVYYYSDNATNWWIALMANFRFREAKKTLNTKISLIFESFVLVRCKPQLSNHLYTFFWYT